MTDQWRHLARGVVVVPGRQYPGIVVMGDTLASMRQDVASIVAYMKEDLKLSSDLLQMDRLEYVLNRLTEALEAYESTLKENGISLPYSR